MRTAAFLIVLVAFQSSDRVVPSTIIGKWELQSPLGDEDVMLEFDKLDKVVRVSSNRSQRFTVKGHYKISKTEHGGGKLPKYQRYYLHIRYGDIETVEEIVQLDKNKLAVYDRSSSLYRYYRRK